MIRITDESRITLLLIVTALAWCLMGCEAERSSKLESANQAYQRGDYATALQQSRAIVDPAIEGDASRRLKGANEIGRAHV